jgi:sulfotransferase
MKTYHFLAGLPRSGNTLLSSILNQNTHLHCSQLSPINALLWTYKDIPKGNENGLRYENAEGLNAVGKNLINNFYSNVNKNVIIDREKCWGVEGNFNLIKDFITPNPKIIFTVRPIIDILSSFISILPEDSYVDRDMYDSGWWGKRYLTKNDNRCDYLMRPYGLIDKVMMSGNIILNPENKDAFCIIEYDELIHAPQQTMDRIYNFLELPTHLHDFNNLITEEDDSDEKNGFPRDFHKIRPKVEKVSKRPEDVLSDYVLNKYSNLEWWRK